MTAEGAASTSWVGASVAPGTRAACSIVLSESMSGADVTIPVHVWRGPTDGPIVCLTGAVHGDELNGTGTIRHLIREEPFDLQCGTLVLVPVVNILGFERHMRYVSDRRDLNRSFPGTEDGSLSSRMAKAFFDQIIRHCDYGIDLHTAALRRTNFPNVRADMSKPKLAEFARAFGAELIVGGAGPMGCLRRVASRHGCLTMVLEAGEVWKVEPGVLEYALRGITNCLRFLDMLDGEPTPPAYRVETDLTKWVRSAHGGFLEFHVAPGDIVERDKAIATSRSLVGDDEHVITAPRDGIVLGMTTLPTVAPGDPICHLAFPRRGALTRVERAVEALDTDSLHERMRVDLASSMTVTESDDDGSA